VAFRLLSVQLEKFRMVNVAGGKDCSFVAFVVIIKYLILWHISFSHLFVDSQPASS